VPAYVAYLLDDSVMGEDSTADTAEPAYYNEYLIIAPIPTTRYAYRYQLRTAGAATAYIKKAQCVVACAPDFEPYVHEGG